VVLVTVISWLAFMGGVPYLEHRLTLDRAENKHWTWQYDKPRAVAWDSWAHRHAYRRKHAQATR
jgi:hypothetical protein